MSADPAAREKTGQFSGPVRVGVVGVGHWGEKHAGVYKRIDNAVLTGLCDLDSARGKALARELDVEFFPALDRLLRKADAISIAVPTVAHFDIARQALEAGVHILLEKPITATLDQADALIELAGSRDLILQAGHLERFNPAFLFLRQSVESPRFIETHRLARFRPLAKDVSVVLDLMTHDIDLVLSLVKADLTAIEAVGVPVLTDKEDITNARLTFADGCIANLTASRVSRDKVRKFRLFERNRYLSADLVSGSVEVISTEAGVGQAGSGGIKLDRRVLRLAPVKPLDDELVDFVKNVRQGKKPAVDGAAARRTLKVALEILDRTGSIR